MTRELHTRLKRWLEAEIQDADAAADAALTSVFASSERLRPSPGFADRVLEAMAPVAARGFATSRLARIAIAASIALAGLAAAALPTVRYLPFDVPTVSGVVRTGVAGIAWVAEWFTTGVQVWDFLARIGLAFRAAAATPEVATALMATLTLGIMALYGLNRILALERSVS